MNFPNINQGTCAAGSPGGPTSTPTRTGTPGTCPDPRCSDPSFAAANPQLCPSGSDDGGGPGGGGDPGGGGTELILKPESSNITVGDSQTYHTFLRNSQGEFEITTGLAYSTSSFGVLAINHLNGNATALSAGVVTVGVTWQDMAAFAQATVMATDQNCSQVKVSASVFLDNSRSMSSKFDNTRGSKFAYAKSVARRFISEIDYAKDEVAFAGFNVNIANHVPFSQVLGTLLAAIDGLPQSTEHTSMLNVITALTDLQAADGDRKVLVLFSDGQDTQGSSMADLITAADIFKTAGGIIEVVAIRAWGDGYTLLSQLASGGYFLNAISDNANDTSDQVSNLKGYYCAGNCTRVGDETVASPALDYHGFVNWDVTAGHVDLIGPYLFDLLPGNGLYVDLAGSSSPFAGVLTSKTNFAFVAGKTYRLSFYLAGNQRQDRSGDQVIVMIGGGAILLHTITPSHYQDDFTLYSYDFTVGGAVSGKLAFEQVLTTDNFFGNLLDRVVLQNVTDNITMLTDNFDAENPTYIPPRCGDSVVVPGYTGDHCGGVGCPSGPPPAQAPDPSPQADIERI